MCHSGVRATWRSRARSAIRRISVKAALCSPVVKADGLAAGKGVILADDKATAIAAADGMLSGDDFGEAFRIWGGGLGIWGAISAGALVGWWLANREGWDKANMLDAAAPACAKPQ